MNDCGVGDDGIYAIAVNVIASAVGDLLRGEHCDLPFWYGIAGNRTAFKSVSSEEELSGEKALRVFSGSKAK